jgi:ABC-type multidrug transport system fused ATPase/permease subunit
MCGFVGQWIFVGAFTMQPFWVGALLQYIADKMNNRPGGAYFLGLENGYYLAASLVATSFLAVLSINSTFYHQTRFGAYLRTATQVMVYEKSMRLSPAARRKYTTGAIVTMMGVDSERIYQGMLTSQWCWAAPVVILVSIFLTIGVLGKAGLVGAGLMVLCMFFQAYSAYGNGKAREILVRLTDERVKLTNEVLQGIRVIKLYCWEGPVGEMIEKVRKEEIVALAALLMIKVTAVVVLFLAPVLVSVVTFTVYFYIDDEPRLDRVFTALAFMNLIRLPMSAMPNAVANLADYRIAMRRVNAFMKEKEMEPAVTPRPPPVDDSVSTGDADIVIRLEHADFTWADDELATASAAAAVIALRKEKEAAAAAKKAAKAKKKGKPKAVIVAKTDADAFTAAAALPATATTDEEAPARAASSALTSPMRHLPLTLENINLKVKRGQLVAVIGAVGAGKSSLVSAVLGEIACVRGRRELEGSIAYVGQEVRLICYDFF